MKTAHSSEAEFQLRAIRTFFNLPGQVNADHAGNHLHWDMTAVTQGQAGLNCQHRVKTLQPVNIKLVSQYCSADQS